MCPFWAHSAFPHRGNAKSLSPCINFRQGRQVAKSSYFISVGECFPIHRSNQCDAIEASIEARGKAPPEVSGSHVACHNDTVARVRVVCPVIAELRFWNKKCWICCGHFIVAMWTFCLNFCRTNSNINLEIVLTQLSNTNTQKVQHFIFWTQNYWNRKKSELSCTLQ